MARASLQASAARVEQARHQPDSRRPRQPTRRTAPHRGARQPTRQRSPRRASTASTSQPPSSAAHAPPRTTPWRAPAHQPAQPASSEHGISLTCRPPRTAHAPPRTIPWRAPAYKPARPASSEHGGGLTAAALGSSRATPHRHRGARQRTSQRSPSSGHTRWRPHSRRPRQPTRRTAPHRGARQRMALDLARAASDCGDDLTAAALGIPRAAQHRTVVHASIEASTSRDEQARHGGN